LKASLTPDKSKEFFKKYDLKTTKYWIALDSNGNVVGTTGFYALKYDENEAYWLGWYCVDKNLRGMGVGRKLLKFIINEAKKNGKKWLRLYTSKDPNEKRANEIYDKVGFKPIKSKMINDLINDKYEFTKNLVYKELRL
jgi:GNAT superfamily N-acetyltransferase